VTVKLCQVNNVLWTNLVTFQTAPKPTSCRGQPGRDPAGVGAYITPPDLLASGKGAGSLHASPRTSPHALAPLGL